MPAVRNPSARVVANRRARVVMNRAVLDAITLGMADGLQKAGEAIIAEASANAPRDPEAARRRSERSGQNVPMMADTGYTATFVDGKLTAGDTGLTGGQQKPRGVSTPKGQVVMVVAFRSHLAHLVELGTVKMAARPFLAPALFNHLGDVGPYVRAEMNARAASASQRADLGAAIKSKDKGAIIAAGKAVRQARAPHLLNMKRVR